MRIVFDLPAHIEQMFAPQGGDANQAVKEAALVELYRQGKLSQGGLADGLGLSRFDADDVLKRHNILNDITVEQHQEDVRQLRKLVKP